MANTLADYVTELITTGKRFIVLARDQKVCRRKVFEKTETEKKFFMKKISNLKSQIKSLGMFGLRGSNFGSSKFKMFHCFFL